MAIAPTLRIATLQGRFPIVDPATGIPTRDFIDALNMAFENTETVVNNQGALLAAIALVNAAVVTAQAAAVVAQTSADAAAASIGIVSERTTNARQFLFE